MFTRRYHIGIFLGSITLATFYLVLPLVASSLLTLGLSRYGYENVIVQLGYPGLWSMRIPVVSFQQNLGGETLLISITNAEIQYRLPQLVRGRAARVSLPDVAVQVLNTRPAGSEEGDEASPSEADGDNSPWSLLTAGDLLHRLPILPFEELHLDRVTIFREEATGPLRKMTISGAMLYREGEMGGHLSFQGRDTASYGLTVTGNSASTWSATLVSQRLQTVPIVSWQSQAHPNGRHIEVSGQLEVNVHELAPFIALLVPIGPELGKVTGHVAVNWAGTAAADAALTSLWRDSRTRLEGRVQAHVTLPALKGAAKDVAVAYQGAFTGNAMQVEWTLAPGVPLVATINTQPHIIPDAVRKMLPRGDQPVRIENAQPVKGTLFWAESPVRLIVDGPLHVTYGSASGPLIAELETKHMEGVGTELLSAEGTYHVAGVVPKAMTDLLSAQEASAEFRGTIALTRTHAQGMLLPSSSVTARQIQRGTAAIPMIMLQLSGALPLQCDLAAVHCSAGPGTIAVRIPAIRVMGHDVRVAHGVLTVQLAEKAEDSWHTQGKLSIRGLSLDAVPWGMPPTDWKIRFLANQAGIKADLHIDVPFQESLVAVEIDQPLTAGQGVLHATVGPIVFDGDDHRLSKLVTGMPLPIEITSGRLASTVDASWAVETGAAGNGFQLISAKTQLVADKLSGRYREYAVKDISTTIALRAQGLESLATVQPAPVTMASLHTGVELTNLSTMIHGTWSFSNGLPVMELKDFRCELFGGMVTSAGFTADLAKPPYRMTFSLQDLDLSKILSVEQNQGLQGTGRLNGTLPVSITSGGLSVKEGTVVGQPPGGIIRYGSTPESSKTIAETNAQLHLVTQALNNFHYSLLQVGVDYVENGTLFLTARLEGKNPDLKTIPPINFNLTVQEHIPTLLKSLRLVEGMEKTMEKKYKRP
jgi:hypothetical protein